MEIVLIVYIVVGLVHANRKVNNDNPALRPLWASDRSLPGFIRLLGLLFIALIWPISMLSDKKVQP